MIYTVEYYREGRLLTGQPWQGPSLAACQAHARNQMMIHKSDFARIIDVDGSGAEVWSERRDA
jgi:hypothetical protein